MFRALLACSLLLFACDDGGSDEPAADADLDAAPDGAAEPTGACCNANACALSTAEACEGTWSEGTCEDVECAPPPEGACCVDNACSVSPEAECEAAGGDYEGDEEACTPELCAPPMPGACCKDDMCTTETPMQCVQRGGRFRGGACEAVDCVVPEQGACCLRNSACGQAQRDVCEDEGGTYMGTDVSCAFIDCLDLPRGACCADGACEERTEVQCERVEGDWTHDLSCEEAACGMVDG